MIYVGSSCIDFLIFFINDCKNPSFKPVSPTVAKKSPQLYLIAFFSVYLFSGISFWRLKSTLHSTLSVMPSVDTEMIYSFHFLVLKVSAPLQIICFFTLFQHNFSIFPFTLALSYRGWKKRNKWLGSLPRWEYFQNNTIDFLSRVYVLWNDFPGVVARLYPCDLWVPLWEARSRGTVSWLTCQCEK